MNDLENKLIFYYIKTNKSLNKAKVNQVSKSMELFRIASARRTCNPPPSWAAIFAKAYSRVMARNQDLGTVMLTIPWYRFYKNRTNVAAIPLKRKIQGKMRVMFAHIVHPEDLPLEEIDHLIEDQLEQPRKKPARFPGGNSFRWVPWPMLFFFWSLALDCFGSVRCKILGTFGLTVHGVVPHFLDSLVPSLPTQIHFDANDESGEVTLTFLFDPRLIDPSTAQKILKDLESTLGDEMAEECTQIAIKGFNKGRFLPTRMEQSETSMVEANQNHLV